MGTWRLSGVRISPPLRLTHVFSPPPRKLDRRVQLRPKNRPVAQRNHSRSIATSGSLRCYQALAFSCTGLDPLDG